MLLTHLFPIMPTLATLFQEYPFPSLYGIPSEVNIHTIVSDSRKTCPDSLFVAIAGENTDGHDFIYLAVEKGAVAVVGEKPEPQALGVPYIQVKNSRQALAYLAAAFYDHPGRKLTMIGVTGTDGKTTTCNLLYRILQGAGIKAGMVSTVNAVIGDEILDTGFHVTTPDAMDVQRFLAKMVDAGLTHVILETTSHGWAQYRVDACEFEIGVITNITHEHLDYHGSFENYRSAKARLFTGLVEVQPKKQGGILLAVLNRDDDSFDYLCDKTKVPNISYGVHPLSDYRAEGIEYTPSGIEFSILHQGAAHRVQCRLAGMFNVSNCLAAYATAVEGLKIDPETALRGISSLESVPGRMERIDLGQAFTAIVDFAHTPNALKSALQAARNITPGRLIVVFGSAGLRDRQKRRMMAEVAEELADISILTAEDPRTESLEAILNEMAQGAVGKGGVEDQSFLRIPDRGEAIRQAVRMAERGDLVIACGKGHEQSMCFGATEYPWDDRQAMRAALSELLDLPPVPMPFLPTQRK